MNSLTLYVFQLPITMHRHALLGAVAAPRATRLLHVRHERLQARPLPDAVFDATDSSMHGDDGPPGDCYRNEGQDRIQSHVDVDMDMATGIDFSTPEDDDVVIASGGDSMVVPDANSGGGEAFTPIDWDLDFAECGDDYCTTRSTNPRRRCVHAAGL